MLELLQPVLVLIVSWLVKKACEYLKIELDEKAFNAIVAGIVVWLVGLVAQQATVSTLAHFGIR